MSKKLIEAAKIWGAALEGDRVAQGAIKATVLNESSAFLSESISTSDLVRTFTAALNQQLLSQYADHPRVWQDYATRHEHNDFRPETVREFNWDDTANLTSNGGVATNYRSLPNIPEATEYPSLGWTQSANALSTRKNGIRVPFTWEDVINDHWDFIASIPGELVQLALNTEQTEATRQLASPTGPNATTFSGLAVKDATAGPTNFDQDYPLTIDSLALAKKSIRQRVFNKRFVNVPKFRLVVPYSLKDQAEAVLGTTSVEVRNSSNTRIVSAKVSNSDVALTVDEWLTNIDQSSTAGTTWYLVPDGGKDSTRESIALGFLKGHTNPDVRVSANTGQYIDGSDVPGLEGSFIDDTIDMRVRHTVASSVLYNVGMLASKGNYTTNPAPAQYGI
jgi:hypothetical protein